MRKSVKLGLISGLAFTIVTSPALAQSGIFLGGMAEGMQQRRDYELRKQELELQRQALEIDRRNGTNQYNELVREQQLRRIERQLRENARLIRESNENIGAPMRLQGAR